MSVQTDIVKQIFDLKREKDAVILAHYYVGKDIQEIADYVGDSYFLAKKSTELNHKTIIFCGVKFMGESAKILNPEKRFIWRMIMQNVIWHIWLILIM